VRLFFASFDCQADGSEEKIARPRPPGNRGCRVLAENPVHCVGAEGRPVAAKFGCDTPMAGRDVRTMAGFGSTRTLWGLIVST